LVKSAEPRNCCFCRYLAMIKHTIEVVPQSPWTIEKSLLECFKSATDITGPCWTLQLPLEWARSCGIGDPHLDSHDCYPTCGRGRPRALRPADRDRRRSAALRSG